MANINSFFPLAILVVTMVFPLISNAKPSLHTIDNPINPLCSKTENKTLCTSIVNGAQAWPLATANAISETLKIATQGKPLFDDLMEKLRDIGLSRISKESIGQTCNEIYDFAVECLKGALDDLKYGYVDRLVTKLSSVTGPSLVCSNSVRKLGVDSPLSKYFSELELYSRICLSITRAT